MNFHSVPPLDPCARRWGVQMCRCTTVAVLERNRPVVRQENGPSVRASALVPAARQGLLVVVLTPPPFV